MYNYKHSLKMLLSTLVINIQLYFPLHWTTYYACTSSYTGKRFHYTVQHTTYYYQYNASAMFSVLISNCITQLWSRFYNPPSLLSRILSQFLKVTLYIVRSTLLLYTEEYSRFKLLTLQIFMIVYILIYFSVCSIFYSYVLFTLYLEICYCIQDLKT